MKTLRILSLLTAALLGTLLLVGVRADNPHGPTVVASVDLTAQTASIGTTTLYTPSAEGDYVVYIYTDWNNIGGSSSVPHFLWDDGTSAQNNVGNCVSMTTANSCIILVHPLASTNIQYSDTWTSGGGMAQFDIHVKVVKL